MSVNKIKYFENKHSFYHSSLPAFFSTLTLVKGKTFVSTHQQTRRFQTFYFVCYETSCSVQTKHKAVMY